MVRHMYIYIIERKKISKTKKQRYILKEQDVLLHIENRKTILALNI